MLTDSRADADRSGTAPTVAGELWHPIRALSSELNTGGIVPLVPFVPNLLHHGDTLLSRKRAREPRRIADPPAVISRLAHAC